MNPDVLRIANCSGFYGDRHTAAREMVDGGPIDVLTGDWLAELTMLILAKDRLQNPDGGYAKTFVRQMEDVLGTCLEKGIKVVANAGGLNPAGCAQAIEKVAAGLGLHPKVAYVEGDDLIGCLDGLAARGVTLENLDTGEKLGDLGIEPITANAYLGGWGIVESLNRGAEVVVTGRVTDAAVVVGPAAAHFGWDRTDWDELAGAVVAGHIIECGAQCTGGNYAFFEEVPGIEHLGFPIAEMHRDGSCVITKHPGTGGLVSVGTITAQLLYEIQGVQYANPDVQVWFNSIRLEQEGDDRVRVHGARGAPGPDQTKVAVNYLGGYRNSMTFVLTGLAVEQKASVAEQTLWSLTEGGKESFESVDVQLTRPDRENPATNDEALAYLRITVMDRDEQKVGRAFSNRVIEMVLASYPGLYTTTPPSSASSYGVYWPALVPSDVPRHEAVVGAERIAIPPAPGAPKMTVRRQSRRAAVGDGLAPASTATPMLGSDPASLSNLLDDLSRQRVVTDTDDTPYWDEVETTPSALGLVMGARSGDKGGNANIGVWTRTADAYDWLRWYLTVDRLRELMPAETGGLDIERTPLPNLCALNFVIKGLLGRGVAASTRTDPQAKGLGEYLRAKLVAVPITLLAGSLASTDN
ncbi:MAG: DUF1446 domain-containing protein [Actinobacteria bacterium]|nr:DUF1446 domain-containing protein [Actinomycetota bacterium]